MIVRDLAIALRCRGLMSIIKRIALATGRFVNGMRLMQFAEPGCRQGLRQEDYQPDLNLVDGQVTFVKTGIYKSMNHIQTLVCSSVTPVQAMAPYSAPAGAVARALLEIATLTTCGQAQQYRGRATAITVPT